MFSLSRQHCSTFAKPFELPVIPSSRRVFQMIRSNKLLTRGPGPLYQPFLTTALILPAMNLLIVVVGCSESKYRYWAELVQTPPVLLL